MQKDFSWTEFYQIDGKKYWRLFTKYHGAIKLLEKMETCSSCSSPLLLRTQAFISFFFPKGADTKMFWHKRMIGNYYFLEAGNNEKTYFGSISTKCFLWSFFTLAAQLGGKKIHNKNLFSTLAYTTAYACSLKHF